MKYAVLSLAILTSTHHVFAMDQAAPTTSATSQNQELDDLTPEETSCFEWFHKLSTEDPSYFKQLPDEDKQVFNKRIQFQDNPELVKRSRTSAVSAFMIQTARKGIEFKFTEEQVVAVLLKVTKNTHAPRSNMVQIPTK